MSNDAQAQAARLSASRNLETLLSDMCRQAADPGLPDVAALNLYRSVADLATALRSCRRDAGLSRGIAPGPIALLDAVIDSARARARALPYGDRLATDVQLLVADLVRIAQSVRATPEPVARMLTSLPAFRAPPVARVSRMEAIFASVFENGLAATGQAFAAAA